MFMSKESFLTPEVLVPRLGDYLVEKGRLTPDRLEYTLDIQRNLKDTGQEVLLGDLLVKLGYIQRSELDQAITEQILQLRNALEEANRTLEQRVIQRTVELQEALNKISELDKIKSNFIANISHELRTPLTHIKGYQELLLAGAMGEINPDQEAALLTIRRSTERLERLIEDLINFSQISHGGIDLHPVKLDLTHIIRNILKQSSLKAEQKHIQLVLQAADEVLPVRGDEEKITWVILQLVDNAIKFTPDNGSVTISVQNQYGEVEVAVEDTGIGIQPDKMQEIFEPFHQLDGSSTRRYGGTGLGLALVKQILDAHHTEIRVTSEPGKFSRFEFKLPEYQLQAL